MGLWEGIIQHTTKFERVLIVLHNPKQMGLQKGTIQSTIKWGCKMKKQGHLWDS